MFSEISFWQYAIFLALVAYFTFFGPTLLRMGREWVIFFRRAQRRGAEIIFGRAVMFILLALFVAPFRRCFYRKGERKKKAMREQLARETRERHQHELELENKRRETIRKEWFKNNRPVLYQHKVSGIIAVMRPKDYEATYEVTRKAVLNETWPDNTVLVSSYNTVIFVTKQGKELLGSGKPRPHGWASDLDDLVKKWNVELVHRPDIFVPYVNESLAPFTEHKTLRTLPSDIERFLITSQTPEEMQPVYPKLGEY